MNDWKIQEKYEIEMDERRVELAERIFQTFLSENVRELDNSQLPLLIDIH